MKKNLQKGFTLIELLVVVAIIGILASVVLASLNSARAKGADAAIKANLANTRAQAALYYDTNSAYSTANLAAATVTSCATASSVFTDPVMVNAIAALTTASGSAPVCTLGDTSGVKANTWAMSSTLKQGSTWCVDSTGTSVGGKVASTLGACI
jgi:prepilin-type N-terminal cleavage/methylation domain-containing protein